MRNLEGRTAISSEDFYEGDTRKQPQSAASHLPDMGNIKEGVRSVAGRLSSMASGIASTIQVLLIESLGLLFQNMAV